MSDRGERDRLPSGDGELEELGDEVIIAQETGAHAPQRRVKVTTDHPSIVISEHPPAHPSNRLPTYRTRRDRTEQTVVIRDRKQLEKMRRQMARGRKKPGVERRTVYLIGVAALASLAMGTLIAALVDSGNATVAPTVRPLPLPEPTTPEPTQSAVPPGTIDLDALPEPSPGPRRSESP